MRQMITGIREKDGGEYSCCVVCRHRIRFTRNLAGWYAWWDSDGNLCRPDPWTQTTHTPERKDAVTYTETEIRIAWENAVTRIECEENAGSTIGVLLEELAKGKGKFTPVNDNDTVTVKEIREAWKRTGGVSTSEQFLKDITDHREPDYPYASIWKDDNGIVWMRAMDDRGKINMWLRMGKEGKFPHETPKRPLRRLT